MCSKKPSICERLQCPRWRALSRSNHLGRDKWLPHLWQCIYIFEHLEHPIWRALSRSNHLGRDKWPTITRHPWFVLVNDASMHPQPASQKSLFMATSHISLHLGRCYALYISFCDSFLRLNRFMVYYRDILVLSINLHNEFFSEIMLATSIERGKTMPSLYIYLC